MKNEWELSNDQYFTSAGKFGVWATRDESGNLTGRATIVYAEDGQSACGDADFATEEALSRAAAMNEGAGE